MNTGPAIVTVRQAKQPLVLTLDVGTSSVRAMIFDAEGHALQGMESQHVHQMRSTADGGVETDADDLFDRVASCIDEVLVQLGDEAAKITAVAPTTFWHNLLGATTTGKALTPVYTWADTRATKAAAELRHNLNPVTLHARTGCVLHPSYLPAKLRWLQHGAASKTVLHQVRHWLSFAEFLTLRLYGSPTCSISMASGSGLLDQHHCQWDAEVLRAIPVDPALLSPLDDTPRRGMQPKYARRWPALANVPWYPGWGDGATSNVGSGCVGRDQVAMMIGTSGAMRTVYTPRRLSIPSDLWCYRVDAKRVVIGGALSNGGNLIEWLRATLHVPEDPRALEAAIAGLPPDGHGLTVLPFLAGERSTGWHSDAHATISGLRLHTQPIEIMRAGHEAVAYRFRLIHELLRAAIPSTGPVIASGGALLHSPAWLQIMADTLGYTVTASGVSEASSRGAALLALEALGTIRDIGAFPAPLGQVYQPDRARTRIYRAAAARQRTLYDLLIAPTPNVKPN